MILLMFILQIQHSMGIAFQHSMEYKIKLNKYYTIQKLNAVGL